MIARAALVLLMVAGASWPVAAQPSRNVGGPPNAMQGFSKNKGKPVHIEAERLEVRDKDKVATFSGKVEVTQGDTTMRCKTLVVFYEGGPPAKGASKGAEKSADGKDVPAKATTQIGPTADQKIKKLEARGSVVVTQNDQVATGDSAVFDMATNTVTMTGNVVMTQGQNVLRGRKLVVDMSTGLSRVEAGGGKDARVQGLFVPSGSERPGLPGKPAPGNGTQKPAR
jgi:lipopolysaccharide export system protein LptA